MNINVMADRVHKSPFNVPTFSEIPYLTNIFRGPAKIRTKQYTVLFCLFVFVFWKGSYQILVNNVQCKTSSSLQNSLFVYMYCIYFMLLMILKIHLLLLSIKIQLYRSSYLN
jgi:hypothetical protein